MVGRNEVKGREHKNLWMEFSLLGGEESKAFLEYYSLSWELIVWGEACYREIGQLEVGGQWNCSYNRVIASGITWSSVPLSLTSHTLRRERKGLVTLQPSSCPHDKILLWPIRSALFIDRIRCHGVQLCHNMFSGCQHLITKPLCSIIVFLGDNSVVAA